jgi:diguanylate cyclase (GGDEF)-like protein/PAS domain S-box-containing protein
VERSTRTTAGRQAMSMQATAASESGSVQPRPGPEAPAARADAAPLQAPGAGASGANRPGRGARPPRGGSQRIVRPWLHPRHGPALRRMVLGLAALAAIQVASLWLPAWGPAANIRYYLPLHTLLETISIVVSLMVFAVGWSSSARGVSANALFLACAFLCVGLLDFSHMASYTGMPDFGSPNDQQKHLNFWLAARLIAAVSLLLLVLRPATAPVGRLGRYLLLCVSLAVAGTLDWVVIAHQSWLPDTFVAGQGLTDFKKTVEYLVTFISLLTAGALLGRMRSPQSFNPVLLFGAVCIMAMSEFYFTVYSTMTGTYNVLGHAYKVAAYLLIYRAIVFEVIEEPYSFLEKARAKFSNIFESVNDGIELISLDGVIVDLNRAAYERLGYARDDVIGRPLAGLCLPADAARFRQQREQVSTHASIMFESSRLCRDGSVIPVEISARLVDMDDRPLILCISRDVSERKHAEAILLKESEKNLAILRNASDGIHILNADGLLIEASDSFCAMLGYARNEIIGRHVSLWDGRFAADEIDARLAHLFAGKTRAQFETVHRRKDGTTFDVEVSSLPLELDGRLVLFNSSRDTSERKAAEREVEHLAFYDALTELPNRRLMLDRLQQAIAARVRTGRNGALLLIDLDNFKGINDTQGHEVGDLLLKRVGKRLASCLRKGDSLARFGGDEFVVMLPELSEAPQEALHQMECVAGKILTTLDQVDQFGRHAYRTTASIGATFFSTGHSAEEHVKQADIAMYQAKHAGRNTLRLFDPAMQESINHRTALENALREALDRQQFSLHYQVQVDSAGRPIGVEALLRWQHPEEGLIMPGNFIELAEETLLIVPIGRWVIETACAQLAAWQHDVQTRDLSVSVNVSAKQIRAADFVASVKESVLRHAVNPRLLILEPTESLFLDDIEDAIATLSAIKAMGVRCSLDDFGTGFSSLQYLKRLPLDQLKIDRSFVRDIVRDASDQTIVRTIIAMAQSLGLEIIAEGVETQAQHDLLRGLGCTLFQGYLFGRPVPVGDLHLLPVA